MGLFDSVMVPCPACSEEVEFQSKSGECSLCKYTLANTPANVLSGINLTSPSLCEGCGTWFSIDADATPKAVPEKWHGYCEQFSSNVDLGAFIMTMNKIRATRPKRPVSC